MFVSLPRIGIIDGVVFDAHLDVFEQFALVGLALSVALVLASWFLGDYF